MVRSLDLNHVTKHLMITASYSEMASMWGAPHTSVCTEKRRMRINSVWTWSGEGTIIHQRTVGRVILLNWHRPQLMEKHGGASQAEQLNKPTTTEQYFGYKSIEQKIRWREHMVNRTECVFTCAPVWWGLIPVCQAVVAGGIFGINNTNPLMHNASQHTTSWQRWGNVAVTRIRQWFWLIMMIMMKPVVCTSGVSSAEEPQEEDRGR